MCKINFHLNKIPWFVVCIVLNCFISKGQYAGYFPDLYNGYFYNMPLVNPSYIADTGKIDLMFTHKLMTGPYREISTSSFIAGRNFANNNTRQSLRLILGNEQEGEYINTPKFFLNYAYSLKLNSDLFMYSGVSLGTTGVYFSAPSATSSFYLPDGSIGLGLKYKSTTVGMSPFQLFNASRYAFSQKRYYHFNASGIYTLSYQWQLKLYALWRLLPQIHDEYKMAILGSYASKVDFGVAVKNNTGLSFIGSFLIPLSAERNDIMVSAVYNTYKFSKEKILPNSLEISIGVLIY